MLDFEGVVTSPCFILPTILYRSLACSEPRDVSPLCTSIMSTDSVSTLIDRDPIPSFVLGLTTETSYLQYRLYRTSETTNP